LNRFDLYELAVQSPLMQARFLRAVHGGRPRTLCEDFCGPASIARAWASLAPDHEALGVDRDPEPLAHARALASSSRLSLLEEDVRRTRAHADIIASFNFAVCELLDRAALLEYLTLARARLAPAGIFAADLYGGPDAFIPGESSQRLASPFGPVLYTWEQREADAFTARVRNAIHFTLPDGTTLRDAFTYDWRLWSVPELRDALAEAGFSHTQVYTSFGDALDDSGNPLVSPAAPWDSTQDNYVVYVVGRTSNR
jgi:hypothetical protein